MRVAVIGAGIIGVNAALAFQEAGAEVALIDRDAPGLGASFGNAGCFAMSETTPISMPGLLWQVPGMLLDPLGPLSLRWGYLPKLAPWLWSFVRAGRRDRVEAIASALKALLGRVNADYQPLLRAAGAEDLIRREGALFIYDSAAALQGAATEWEIKRQNGIAFDTLDAPALRDLEPALSASRFVGGKFVPDWWHTVDPHAIVTRLHDLFLSRAATMGGTSRRAEVAQIATVDGGARLTFQGAAAEDFDHVVIACGVQSRRFCRDLGQDLPLDTERGYNVTLSDPGVTLTRPVTVASRGYFMTPMAMGLRIGGGVELGGLDAKPNWARAEAMLTDARTALPGLQNDAGSRWMGFRPSMPDSLPVIGPLPGTRRVSVAFGHGHMGLTFGATTGRLVADLALGRPPAIDPTPYCASRFG